MSYRALFGWLNPWILIPSLIVSPICQILLFAYIGRSAGVGDDEFYVIGNALNYAAIPCLFAMASTIEGEREGHTLGHRADHPGPADPAVPRPGAPGDRQRLGRGDGRRRRRRTAARRAHPGGGVAGARCSSWSVTSASCTGLGLAMGAVALRVREGATLGNVVFCVLLVFCGVNVALEDLPGWMAAGRAAGCPLTHGIEAARLLADGEHAGRRRRAGRPRARRSAPSTPCVGLVLLRVLRAREPAPGHPRPDLSAGSRLAPSPVRR